MQFDVKRTFAEAGTLVFLVAASSPPRTEAWRGGEMKRRSGAADGDDDHSSSAKIIADDGGVLHIAEQPVCIVSTTSPPATQAVEFRRVLTCASGRGSASKQRLMSAVVICVGFMLAMVFSDPQARTRGAVMALAFSAIETIQYVRTRRGCFTTVDQFFANIVYCSVVLDRWQLMTFEVWWLRVLMGPLTIWLLEVVQNYALLFAFGRNTAWCYTGATYGYCHGAIDLAMCHLWWMLATVLEVAHPLVLVPLSEIEVLSGSINVVVCAALAAVLIVGAVRVTALPRYPPSLAVWPRAQHETRGIALLDWTYCPPRIVELGSVHKLDGRMVRPAFDISTATMTWVPL
eukprot:COSAG02_NODE_3435_length_6748_cov_4.963303_5_plen_346_part_00